jgi:hypothetical protein
MRGALLINEARAVTRIEILSQHFCGKNEENNEKVRISRFWVEVRSVCLLKRWSIVYSTTMLHSEQNVKSSG